MKEPTLIYVLWVGLGATFGVIGLGLRAIIKGDLVPKSTLDRAYAESDKWQAAWHTSQKTMGEFSGRLDANTESLGFMRQLVEALAAKGPVR